MFAHIKLCMHERTCTHTHTHTNTNMNECTIEWMYTDAHIYTHTHTHSKSLYQVAQRLVLYFNDSTALSSDFSNLSSTSAFMYTTNLPTQIHRQSFTADHYN